MQLSERSNRFDCESMQEFYVRINNQAKLFRAFAEPRSHTTSTTCGTRMALASSYRARIKTQKSECTHTVIQCIAFAAGQLQSSYRKDEAHTTGSSRCVVGSFAVRSGMGPY